MQCLTKYLRRLNSCFFFYHQITVTLHNISTQPHIHPLYILHFAINKMNYSACQIFLRNVALLVKSTHIPNCELWAKNLLQLCKKEDTVQVKSYQSCFRILLILLSSSWEPLKLEWLYHLWILFIQHVSQSREFYSVFCLNLE